MIKRPFIIIFFFVLTFLPILDYAQTPGMGAPTVQVKNNIIEFSGLNADTMFANFPEAFCYVQNVESLKLSSHSFVKVPPCIQNYKRTLRKLDLHNNKLTSLPAEISNLPFLESADLSGNALTTLPNVSGWTAISNLNLSNNPGLILDNAGLGNLTRLELLDISGNKLAELPDAIASLTRLKDLNISGNSITEVPAWFAFLVNLKTLNVKGNGIEAGPQRTVLNTLFANQGITITP